MLGVKRGKSKAHISISDMPPIKSSSSRSSKTLIKSLGTSSSRPSIKASNCSLTRFDIRYATTESTYSFLFSSVTATSSPPGFSSIVTSSPNRSSAVVKVSSRTSVMSFSLHRKVGYVNHCAGEKGPTTSKPAIGEDQRRQVQDPPAPYACQESSYRSWARNRRRETFGGR